MTVTVRNLVLGNGTPKICVPLTGTDINGLVDEVREVRQSPADMAEWRVDYFLGANDIENVAQALRAIRQALGDMPLLFTFRTKAEGGVSDISVSHYAALNKAAAESGCVDLIDIELFTSGDTLCELVEIARANGMKTVMSNHDFEKTPSAAEMAERLKKMCALGADLPKIAVMPRSIDDVLSLLSVTNAVSSELNRPIVTMSMGEMGVITRVAGAYFGSCLTFGAVRRASAPGQLAAADLKTALEIIQRAE